MKEPILNEIFRELEKKYSCCQLSGIPIHILSNKEKEFFSSFMPDAITAIVVAHHVVTVEEWTWYQPFRGSERCDADDHTFEVCRRIEDSLKKEGFKSKIVPYPYESGLEFRNVAQSAGIGQIGKNAFLLHPMWGPWVHLRVLSTEAPVKKIQSLSKNSQDVCGDCTKCMDSCPAGAFTHGFNGLVCRRYRKEKGEYTPIGRGRVYKYCKICALVCPLGKIKILP